MKVEPRNQAAFLRSIPSEVQAVLVYGGDRGLVQERAQTLAKQKTPDLKDAFSVALLSPETLGEQGNHLREELYSLSLMGGDRLVWLKGAGDGQTKLIADLLETAKKSKLEALFLVTAGSLTGKSTLVSLFRKSKIAAEFPCYHETVRDLQGFIRAFFQEEGFQIEADALLYLAQNLGGDRGLSRRELEKVVLYKGPRSVSGAQSLAPLSKITLEDVQLLVGDSSALSFDDLLQAVFEGRLPAVDQIYQRLLAEGGQPIVLLQSLTRYLLRLYQARSLLEQGKSPEEAITQLRPPVFWKVKRSFIAQIQVWDSQALEKSLRSLQDLSIQSRRLSPLSEELVGRALLSLAVQANRLKAKALRTQF